MCVIYNKTFEKILAVLAMFTIFYTRFNEYKALLLNGFLLFFCVFLSIVHRKEIIPVSDEIKGYIKAFMIYFLCIIPSSIFSDKPLLSFLNFFFSLFIYGVFTVIILFIRRRELLVNMLMSFFWFSSFDCIIAFFQPILGYGMDNRGYGFGGWCLHIADIMCMLMPLALVIVMDPRFESRLKHSAAFASISIIFGLLGNKSRGAWLTELFVVPIAVYKYVKHNRKYLICVLLVTLLVAGYMVSTPQYINRIKSITNTTTDHSNADRIWAWKSAKLMISDYPVTGVGFGRFHEIYEKKYKYEQETQNLFHTHNNFVQVAVDTGLVGTLGFFYLIWYFLHTSLWNYRKKSNPYDLLLFIIFLAHICIFGQIDYTLWGFALQPFFLFLFALLLRLKETDVKLISLDTSKAF